MTTGEGGLAAGGADAAPGGGGNPTAGSGLGSAAPFRTGDAGAGADVSAAPAGGATAVDLRRAPVPMPPRPVFGLRWLGPQAPPSRRVQVGVLAAGIGSAVAVSTDRAGLGMLLAALVIVGATLTAGRFRPVEAGWALAAVGLVAVGSVRAAEWLVVLCVFAAAGAWALAVAGPSFRSMALVAGAAAVAPVRGVPWLGTAFRSVRGTTFRRGLRVTVAAGVGLALVAVFGALLGSADAAFAALLDAAVPELDASALPEWIILFGLGAGAALGGCFLVAAPAPPLAAVSRPARLRGIEWALPVTFVVALFAAFVAVQFAALFGGDEYVRTTTGLTYAEYARGGFWQLVAVSVLALAAILEGARLAPPAHRALSRALLVTLAALCLVIVASAVNRMRLYEQAYGSTILRLLVFTCELWLGVCFLLAAWHVLAPRPAGPMRRMLAAGVLALLAFAVVDPERLVAERSVARFAETGKIDVEYLADLSADAVPTLMTLPEPQRGCALAEIAAERAPDGWREANVARATASGLLAEYQPECTTSPA